MGKERTIDHDEVLRLHKSGLTPAEIGEKVNATAGGIYYILNKYVWQPKSAAKLGAKIQFRVPPELRQRAELLAQQEKVGPSELMRLALREYLDNHHPSERKARRWK